MRQILEEVDEHHGSLIGLIQRQQDQTAAPSTSAPSEAGSNNIVFDAQSDASAILVHHQALLRNKRVLLAYMYVNDSFVYIVNHLISNLLYVHSDGMI